MYLLPTLLPLFLCLGQSVSGAAVQVNILVNDKQVSIPSVSSTFHHGKESFKENPERPFQLRAITVTGEEINVEGDQPLYFDYSVLRVFPPRMEIQKPIRGEPAAFTLSGNILTGVYGGRIGALDNDGWMISADGIGLALDFTTVYLKSASAQVLAIAGKGDANPGLFKVQGDLKRLNYMNNVYACVPELQEKCSDKMSSIYLKIVEVV